MEREKNCVYHSRCVCVCVCVCVVLVRRGYLRGAGVLLVQGVVLATLLLVLFVVDLQLLPHLLDAVLLHQLVRTGAHVTGYYVVVVIIIMDSTQLGEKYIFKGTI